MNRYLSVLIVPFLFSCAASKNYNPNKKYSAAELKEDYQFVRNVLQDKHPSLYWYTSKDSMDRYFRAGYRSITDSMTELQFGWKVLAPLTAAIHDGHTSFSMSKKWNHFIRGKSIPSFPLFLKVWSDTMMVIGNLHRKDSLISNGDFVTAINGISSRQIIHHMFNYMVQDGYADNVNYIRLSGSFPYFHRNIFGLYKNYVIDFTDSTGQARNATLPYFSPDPDSVKKRTQRRIASRKQWTRQQRLERIRSLEIDSNYALMTVNTFSGGHLKSFFRRSFRQLRKRGDSNLVIDLRANGGGDIVKSVLLTRYLRNTPFKVADSAYAISRTFRPYTSHISRGFLNNLGLLFVTNKKKDGNYHFGYWERHYFKPRRKNHFDGNVYVLINGLTFSASSLFCNAVKGQPNITLVGEETGGGWYGNSGILIPTVTLPNTGLRLRLPLFRLVQFEHEVAHKGSGILPDIPVGPDWRDVLKGVDTKIEAVKKIISQKQLPATP